MPEAFVVYLVLVLTAFLVVLAVSQSLLAAFLAVDAVAVTYVAVTLLTGARTRR